MASAPHHRGDFGPLSFHASLRAIVILGRGRDLQPMAEDGSESGVSFPRNRISGSGCFSSSKRSAHHHYRLLLRDQSTQGDLLGGHGNLLDPHDNHPDRLLAEDIFTSLRKEII